MTKLIQYLIFSNMSSYNTSNISFTELIPTPILSYLARTFKRKTNQIIRH